MDKEPQPLDSKPEGEAPEGESKGGENVDALSLESLNKELGKDFKDVESALASLKETNSFVGKKKEDIAKDLTPPVDPSIAEKMDTLEKRLDESNFYKDNPQYNNKETIDLIKGLGGKPEEVVEKDVFKNIFEKTSAYDKSQESKSVLHNSSRLAQASTKMDDAGTAMEAADLEASKGNLAGALDNKRKADYNAVQSVVDTFNK